MRPVVPTAPTADQAGLAEQGLLDRQRIEARHVPIRVAAFDPEAIELRGHGRQNRAAGRARPMNGLNQRTRIDSLS